MEPTGGPDQGVGSLSTGVVATTQGGYVTVRIPGGLRNEAWYWLGQKNDPEKDSEQLERITNCGGSSESNGAGGQDWNPLQGEAKGAVPAVGLPRWHEKGN